MPAVPLPDTPCVRVRLIYNQETSKSAGNRFYLSYTGGPPTGADCATIASGIATAWNTNLASLVWDGNSLQEVDVLDIASDSGLSGQWTGSDSGSRSGAFLPDSVAFNIEFGIARRYRGGKPRIFFPFGVQGDLHDQSNWLNTFTPTVQTNVEAFFTACQALSSGSTSIANHVNLSYYKGFTNFLGPSGRERAVPTYRATALSDVIVGYSAKQLVGSQRRRRTSTTP